MYRVKQRETEQVCEFDTKESLDGFVASVPDADKWDVVEEAPGTQVVLDGEPVEPSGNAAELTDAVLDSAAKNVVAGEYSLAYAASGIAGHYGKSRDEVLGKLRALIAPLVGVEAQAVDGELEARAQERVASAERAKLEAESRSGG